MTAANTTLIRIETQGMSLARQIGRLNGEFKDGLHGISEHSMHFRVTEEACPTLASSSRLLADGESSHACRSGPYSSIGHQSLHPEQSLSEAQLISHSLGCEQQEGMIRRAPASRPWRVVSRQSLNFWLVRADLETKETIQNSASREHEDAASEASSGRKSISAYFRIPFFRRKVVFEYQYPPCSYSNRFDMQLRTYNILPEDAPIFEACRCFDLPRVQQLLQTKSASPFDLCSSSSLDPETLLDVTLFTIASSIDRSYGDTIVAQGWDLLKFLLPFFREHSRILDYALLGDLIQTCIMNGAPNSAMPDTIRAILRQSSENPFETDLAPLQ